jgi:RimJ/RimL family protein N-acetyltransferase
VIVRPWLPEDVPSLARACNDPEIARWLRVPSPYTIDSARAYLDTVKRWWDSGEAYALAIADASTIIGSISIQPGAERPSIGYWLAADARGRGIATRAVEAIAGWAAERFGLTEAWIFAQPANVASCRVALRAGFVEQDARVTYPDGKERAVFRLLIQRSQLST